MSGVWSSTPPWSDFELARHVRDGLLGEKLVGIALAVQAGHHAVADELVVARALHRGHVLDAGLRVRHDAQRDQRGGGEQRGGDGAMDDIEVRTVRGIHRVW
jgi:hypothetical protein